MEVPDLNELLNVRPTIKLENNEVTFVDENSQDGENDPLSMMPQFVTENDLGLMQPGGDLLQSAPLAVFSDAGDDDDTMQSEDSSDEVIVQLMDIRTPLTKLRTMLEQRIGVDLSEYTFWLQDAKQLEPHRTLAAQCVRGAGVVQVNLRLIPSAGRINILDVLKPDDEPPPPPPPPAGSRTEQLEELTLPEPETKEDEDYTISDMTECNTDSERAAAVKWVVDDTFRQDGARDKTPNDPADWSVQHVKMWIVWAVRQFNLKGVKLADWNISGVRLCAMTNTEFKEKVPSDPGDIFWTHFELLRKCKFVAIVQNDDDADQEMTESSETDQNNVSATDKATTAPSIQYATINKKKKTAKSLQYHMQELEEERTLYAARGGNNGQVQLWQFLLELLTSAEYYDVIRWNGSDGQFILVEPEKVARLWGIRKHKPAMNYEKLSRALRYYYDGDMIAKVTGQRFVYKFVCDLKQLLGYSAGELAIRVAEVRSGLQDGTYQPEITEDEEEIMEILNMNAKTVNLY